MDRIVVRGKNNFTKENKTFCSSSNLQVHAICLYLRTRFYSFSYLLNVLRSFIYVNFILLRINSFACLQTTNGIYDSKRHADDNMAYQAFSVQDDYSRPKSSGPGSYYSASKVSNGNHPGTHSPYMQAHPYATMPPPGHSRHPAYNPGGGNYAQPRYIVHDRGSKSLY